MKLFTAIYCLFVGVSVIGMWGVLLFSGGISEGSVEITFHVISEFLMAFLLLLSGLRLLRKAHAENQILFLSLGLLIYSTLNAAGYYIERSNFIMSGMLLTLFFLSVFLVIISLKTNK